MGTGQGRYYGAQGAGAGGGLWDQALQEQGPCGLCLQAEPGSSWTDCVCPQEIRDPGGFPGPGGRPCGPARWQDPSATQQRPPSSEAVQPQPAQGGEACLRDGTPSQIPELDCLSLPHFPFISAACFSLPFLCPTSLYFQPSPCYRPGLCSALLAPLGARGFFSVRAGSMHGDAIAVWGII